MRFDPELEQGILIRRYQRFLADISGSDGRQITIHCPNTGSMRNCLFPGNKVWYSSSNNPKRKYPNTWELAQADGDHLIGVNTHNANKLVVEAVETGRIVEVSGYSSLRCEVKYGDENSRIDLLLEDKDKPNCYIEVKSCTLAEGNRGYFPDAVTTRGQKHLRELMQMVAQGHRAVLLFVVQHSAITSVAPADHIDGDYARLLERAHQQGVEILAYHTQMSVGEISLSEPCPVDLPFVGG